MNPLSGKGTLPCLPFADTTLVRVPKPRIGSKYSGVLRSPQKLKMFWGPHSRERSEHRIKGGKATTQVRECNELLMGEKQKNTSKRLKQDKINTSQRNALL